MFSKSTLFQKNERCSIRLRFFKKKCPNGIRKCKRVTSNKLPFRKVIFYKFRTINVSILVWHFAGTQTDSFKTRAWNFTLLILASYSFRTLCSLVLAFVSLALSGLFDSVLSLCCFVSVFVWPPCRKIFMCSCAFGWAE